MFTFPEIDPVIFGIGPLKIRWYGLMYVLGFLFTWWLAKRRSHRADTPVNATEVDDLIFYGMLGVILGGRIGYSIIYGWDQLTSDPLYLFKITEGGMSFHGGLAGVLIAMWLHGRKLGKTMWQMTDFVAPFVPIGLGLGRIGNFINGELWGGPTNVPWGVLYRGQVLHPSQLYEALLEGLVLFLILWFYSAKQRPYMAVSGMFLLFYGIFRYFVEFYRTPDQHLQELAADWGMTMGQILSTPMIIIGGILLAMAHMSNSNKANA
jgi:phosphatidylglycerol:prolipoprotein diacylglycerol transferase